MSTVLVVNSGSSSIKYQLIDMTNERVVAKGVVERIGEEFGVISHTFGETTARYEVDVPNPHAGFVALIAACARYGPDLPAANIVAVGHRVVQGGALFSAPTLVDDSVLARLDGISGLAPVHHEPNIRSIRAARLSFPDIPHVIIFDTAFHQTMPPAAYLYAINFELAEQHKIRRYGFHGTSHKYVSELAAEYLQLPLADVNTIVLHIGNGASACAVRGGKSVETSMGLTPLEGLVMGSRSGDIDPSVLTHLAREAHMTADDIDDLLNRRSGLLGMFGSGDMRDVMDGVRSGVAEAQLALDVYCHRIKHYIGAYFAQLGRVDCIVFTAGVGENNPEIRAKSLENLEHMGIHLDHERNTSSERGTREISGDDSPVKVLVIPTNEELEIARETAAAIA